ncbi:hypothetical protein DSL92_01035 [Billgrantia gudaonensis]|uniref:Uncharacterized protein n=1 Tax=Billgrantia gudaonensis TaxID=376427 RepID=A0A3S0NEL2_9GAMM|nr:hypothetical protein DSL92_01035 [Halomonas gudaonensis]
MRFFHCHGLLPPQRPDRSGTPWWAAHGPTSRPRRFYAQRIRLANPPVFRPAPPGRWRALRTASGYERLIRWCCHADQALALLDDPSPAERHPRRTALSRQPSGTTYRSSRLLSRRRRAWAVELSPDGRGDGARVSVTYAMNIPAHRRPESFCVTLNDSAAIDPRRILAAIPMPTRNSAAPARCPGATRRDLGSTQRTHYCGALLATASMKMASGAPYAWHTSWQRRPAIIATSRSGGCVVMPTPHSCVLRHAAPSALRASPPRLSLPTVDAVARPR